MEFRTSDDFSAAPPSSQPGDERSSGSQSAATPFEQLARQYISLSEPRWGAHAATTTKSVIRKHLIAKLGHLPANKLTSSEIQTFINEMVRSNASSSLLSKVVAHLRGILDLAQESGALAINPMRSRTAKIDYQPQKPASERHLSLDECAALLTALTGRDLLIVRMFIQLGLRPQELFALRLNDVRGEFLRIDEVLIKRRVKKLGEEESALGVYLPPDLRAQLEGWIKSTAPQDADWLFPASRARGTPDLPPLNLDHFRNRILKQAAEKANVPDVDIVALRRTCASLFAHKATAQDTLTQLRQVDPGHRAEPGEKSVPKSLKRAAVAIEVELLKVIKRAEEKSRRAADATSGSLSSAAKSGV